MIETHPFGSFVPPDARYIICGSFTGKEAYDPEKKKGTFGTIPMVEEINFGRF